MQRSDGFVHKADVFPGIQEQKERLPAVLFEVRELLPGKESGIFRSLLKKVLSRVDTCSCLLSELPHEGDGKL